MIAVNCVLICTNSILKHGRFSGKEHEVLTGVCLMAWNGKDWKEITFCEHTTVKFGQLSREEITAYIDTGEPLSVLCGKHGGFTHIC